MNDDKKLPSPVIRRLPKYLTHVQELKTQDLRWVSSTGLANALGLTSSTVRQDLSHLDLKGVSKRGYETHQLEAVLLSELGADTVHRLVIVGAGYLGTALALHGSLARHGFETCGIFDADTELVGTKVGDFSIRPMNALRTVVRRKKVDVGVIAVPARAAQDVAERLVKAGVKGLLNLAYIPIHVPRDIVVMDARLLASLQELAYFIRAQNGARPRTSRSKKQNQTGG